MASTPETPTAADIETAISSALRRRWVTTRQLAEHLQVSTCTILRYNQLPGAPVLRFRRALRYDLDKYVEWIEGGGVMEGERLLTHQIREAHG